MNKSRRQYIESLSQLPAADLQAGDTLHYKRYHRWMLVGAAGALAASFALSSIEKTPNNLELTSVVSGAGAFIVSAAMVEINGRRKDEYLWALEMQQSNENHGYQATG